MKPTDLSVYIQAFYTVSSTAFRVAAEDVDFASQTTATMCISRSLEIWSSGPHIVFNVVLLDAVVKLILAVRIRTTSKEKECVLVVCNALVGASAERISTLSFRDIVSTQV